MFSQLSRRIFHPNIKYSTNLISKRGFFQFVVTNDIVKRWTESPSVVEWINERIQIFNPSRVHLCDGSEEEYEMLINKQLQQGTLIRLNPKLRPNSFLARSSVKDVARVEERTFICSESAHAAGPTNKWEDPESMHQTMNKLFSGSMKGRTMYVIPFCMGPLRSPFSIYGIQVTDSPYVVCSMRAMTRMGKEIMRAIEDEDAFWVPCVHSVGMPLDPGVEDVAWPCNDTKYIVHFPEERRIWSYGSGYGGNAILGKKCLALRLASVMARDDEWLAEHMLIIGVTNPKGVKKYFLGCFPSACGKTNLAMLQSQMPGWKVECLGDDIAWIRRNPQDGKLYAINPENGFFGVAPGTSWDSNPVCMETIRENTIFTNVAVTPDNDVWWEGMTNNIPNELIAWTRQEWGPETIGHAAHANSRFCCPISQCPSLDRDWENPKGVPISAIIFGGRRSQTIPLVYQTFDWEHGVYTGSVMGSEKTAAAAGLTGLLRIDPFSMRPFCGYNMAHYFEHWLNFGKNQDPKLLPKIFNVNWFKKDKSKFIWPGFGENIRVLKWIFERCELDDNTNENNGHAITTPIGMMPTNKSLDTTGISDMNNDKFNKLFEVNYKLWEDEIQRHKSFYSTFEKGDIPNELWNQLDSLKERLDNEAELKLN